MAAATAHNSFVLGVSLAAAKKDGVFLRASFFSDGVPVLLLSRGLPCFDNPPSQRKEEGEGITLACPSAE